MIIATKEDFVNAPIMYKQKALEEFVDKHVKDCVTSWVEYMIDHDEDTPLHSDEFSNWYDEDECEWKDVLEWYVVDEWLVKKLEDKGEVVSGALFNSLWGRQESGQAIFMDNIIRDIYLETLED